MLNFNNINAEDLRIYQIIDANLDRAREGLRVLEDWADVVMILTPDELQAEIYKNHIEQRVREGTSIAFAHGLNVHYDLIKARKDLDVFMVAPKGPGHLVRSEFEKGGGVPCLFAVHQDGSGKARDLTIH